MADLWKSNSNTWAGAGLAFGEATPVFLSSDVFYQADTNFFGEEIGTIDVLLERVGLPLIADKVDPSSIKLITRIWPLIIGKVGDTIDIAIGTQQNSPAEAPVYETAKTWTIGTTEFIDALASGRYLCFKITSAASGQTAEPWTLVNYVIDFEVIGLH